MPKNLPPVTPADLRAWGACWSDLRIADAFAGRDSVSVVEALRCDDVTPVDRVWLGCQYLARHDRAALVTFAQRCAAAAAAAARWAAATATAAAAAAAHARQVAWLLEALKP